MKMLGENVVEYFRNLEVRETFLSKLQNLGT